MIVPEVGSGCLAELPLLWWLECSERWESLGDLVWAEPEWESPVGRFERWESRGDWVWAELEWKSQVGRFDRWESWG